MKVRISTYDVSTSETVAAEMETDGVISDASARAIAQWYHSPNWRDAPLLQLGQGSEFDLQELSERIETCGMDPAEYNAMRDWVDTLGEKMGAW